MIPIQGCPQSKENELVSGTGIWSIKIPDVKCVFTEELWDAVRESFFFVSFFTASPLNICVFL